MKIDKRTDNIVKEGNLDKRSLKKSRLSFVKNAFGGGWSSRRFVLLREESLLLYYAGAELKGEIDIKESTAQLVDSADADGRIFSFEIIHCSGLRTILCAANDEQDAIEWVDAINLLKTIY